MFGSKPKIIVLNFNFSKKVKREALLYRCRPHQMIVDNTKATLRQHSGKTFKIIFLNFNHSRNVKRDAYDISL